MFHTQKFLLFIFYFEKQEDQTPMRIPTMEKVCFVVGIEVPERTKTKQLSLNQKC